MGLGAKAIFFNRKDRKERKGRRGSGLSALRDLCVKRIGDEADGGWDARRHGLPELR